MVASNPEVCGSNASTGCIERTKIKKIEAGNGPILKNTISDQNVLLTYVFHT